MIPGWKITAKSDRGNDQLYHRVAVMTRHQLTRGRHQIDVGFPGKDAQQVQDVEQQVLVWLGYLCNQRLVSLDSSGQIRVGGFQIVSEIVVQLVRDNGLRHLSQVSTKDGRNIMCRIIVLFPVEVFTILWIQTVSQLQSFNWQIEPRLTLGGLSKMACSSFIRLVDPETLNVPGTSVAVSLRWSPHLATTTGT